MNPTFALAALPVSAVAWSSAQPRTEPYGAISPADPCAGARLNLGGAATAADRHELPIARIGLDLLEPAR